MTKSSADDSCQLVRRSGKRKRRGTRRFGLLSASKFGKIPRLLLLLLIFFVVIFLDASGRLGAEVCTTAL